MNNKKLNIFKNDRSGISALIITVALIFLLSIAALAFDVGYIYVTRNQLQNVADAAALAAARQLGNIYSNMETNEEVLAYNAAGDKYIFDNVAQDVASKNIAGNKYITIDTADVEVGVWDPDGNPRFTQTYDQPDAIRVTTRRDDITNGPLTLFFAKIFGVNTTTVRTDAVAALTSQSTTIEGELELPIGISEYRFEVDYCDDLIRFYPTGDLDGCAGWNVFDETPFSANKLDDILTGLEAGTYESPATSAEPDNETYFTFGGGNVASVFEELEILFDNHPDTLETDIPLFWGTGGVYEGQLIEPTDEMPDPGADPNIEPIIDDITGEQKLRKELKTSVVVYESDDCSNPSGSIKIVGYATITLLCVNTSHVSPSAGFPAGPKNTIFGIMECGDFSDGRGGGGSNDFGTKGTIPGLVE